MPRERAFIKGHAGDDGDIHLPTRGKQFIFRILIEDVVNDLYRIYQSAANCFHSVPGFPTINTDTHGAEQTLSTKLVHFLHPTIVFNPTVFPDMKLHQVETFQSGVLDTLMHLPFDVVGRESIADREFAPAVPSLII